jgi:hypothetical protein
MLTGGGSWFGRVGEVVVGFFNPGIAGWLFILFFNYFICDRGTNIVEDW